MVRILDKIKEIQDYAIINNVPIMQNDSVEYIKNKINSLKLYDILEIGSAIGYSSIYLAASNENVKILTIEKDEERYNKAVENINNINFNEKIKIIFDDALNVSLKDKYDLIIIDAAKGKNINFFEHFKMNLKPNGIIIIDNIEFHGLVGNSESIKSKNLRKLVSKIEKSIEFLKIQEDFSVEFIQVGDGLAVCQRK